MTLINPGKPFKSREKAGSANKKKAAEVYLLTRASGGQMKALDVDQLVEIEKLFPTPPRRK